MIVHPGILMMSNEKLRASNRELRLRCQALTRTNANLERELVRLRRLRSSLMARIQELRAAELEREDAR